MRGGSERGADPRRVPQIAVAVVLGIGGLLGALTATSSALAVSLCIAAVVVLVAMVRQMPIWRCYFSFRCYRLASSRPASVLF